MRVTLRRRGAFLPSNAGEMALCLLHAEKLSLLTLLRRERRAIVTCLLNEMCLCWRNA